MDIGDLAASCLGTMIPIAGNITQQSALLIDLYLSPQYEKEKARIVDLSRMDTKEADEELLGYIWEGERRFFLRHPFLPVVSGRSQFCWHGTDRQVCVLRRSSLVVSRVANCRLASLKHELISPFLALVTVPRVAANDVTVDDGVRGPIKIKKGELVVIAISKAHMDPTHCPDPEKIDPTRPRDSYMLVSYSGPLVLS